MTALLTFATTVIYVDDVPATLDFYRRAFGLEPRYYDEPLGFAQLGPDGAVSICSHAAGQLMLDGAYQRAPEGRVAGVEVAFTTADVAGAFERAVAAGAGALTPPRVMPWGQTVAYVTTPEGAIVGLLTLPPAESGAQA